jgi:hypothetical protein
MTPPSTLSRFVAGRCGSFGILRTLVSNNGSPLTSTGNCCKSTDTTSSETQPDGIPAVNESTASTFPNFRGDAPEPKTVKPDAEKPTKEELEDTDEAARIKVPGRENEPGEPYPSPT